MYLQPDSSCWMDRLVFCEGITTKWRTTQNMWQCWAPDGHDPRHFEQFSRTCAPGVEVNGFTCASVWQFLLHLQQQSWKDKSALKRFTEQTHVWPFQSSVVCRPTYCLTSCTTYNSMNVDSRSASGARTFEAVMYVQLSGGSRIFPRGGREPSRGGVNTPNFPKNCMKSKEFGRPGGGVRPSRPPLDPPMQLEVCICEW